MRRVLVLGSSGSGKSTFARRLSAATRIPMVSLDALYWQPGWRPADPFSFERRVTDAANEPTWIMDGNYLSQGAGALRRALADTIIWFDLPRWVCMTGIFLRIVQDLRRGAARDGSGLPGKARPRVHPVRLGLSPAATPQTAGIFQGLAAGPDVHSVRPPPRGRPLSCKPGPGLAAARV